MRHSRFTHSKVRGIEAWWAVIRKVPRSSNAESEKSRFEAFHEIRRFRFFHAFSHSLLIARSARHKIAMKTSLLFVPETPQTPNKAPEPTPPSVTPRAYARVAPAGVVAHL